MVNIMKICREYKEITGKECIYIGIIAIASIFLNVGWIIGIMAIVYGIITYRKAELTSAVKNCKVGIVLGVIAFTVSMILIIATGTKSIHQDKPADYGLASKEDNYSALLNTNMDEMDGTEAEESESLNGTEIQSDLVTLENLPEYSGTAYVYINGNEPYFDTDDLIAEDAIILSPLDDIGRCGPATIVVCNDNLPTEKRGDISDIKPTGWHNKYYEGYVDGGWLLNRCHLIMYALSGLNDVPENLISGTRYMNTEGMYTFEEEILNYVVQSNGEHIIYRASPIYSGDNLFADGVLLEAESVEDIGESFELCVYCYNVQPGFEIDYSTGENWIIEDYEGEYVTESVFSEETTKGIQ